MAGRYAGAVEVEDQGRSPLVYNRSESVRRLAAVDRAAPAPAGGDTYFAETSRSVRTGKGGRLLKRPRVEVTPGAAPGTVAFLDYHEYGPRGLYIDYMKTRQDYRGRGLARRLVDELIARHPDLALLHFGKLMNPTVGKIFAEAEKRYGATISFASQKYY